MVNTRKRESQGHQITKKSKQDSSSDSDSDSVSDHEENTGDDSNSASYEQFRNQRIKENMLRMQKLGIPDLSRKLNPVSPPSKRPSRVLPGEKSPSVPSEPSRRSTRLKTMNPVSYAEKEKRSPKGKSAMDLEIRIPEGSKPEVYTEEHDKLLGDCKTPWIVLEDGKRVHDPVNGVTCHQCRQKTLALHAKCSTCVLVQGQLCGDCLQARYGENVIEANQNPNWICPACRGICNCSFCRKAKGWAPTGNIWKKVFKLGFKSVAHYLIQTRRVQTTQEVLDAENRSPARRPLSFDDNAEPLNQEVVDAENQSPAQTPLSFNDDAEPNLVNSKSFHTDNGNLKPESEVKIEEEEMDKSMEEGCDNGIDV